MQLNTGDNSDLAIRDYKGGLAITGSDLVNTFNHFNTKGNRAPSNPLHITLVTAAERKALDKSSSVSSIPLTNIYVLGLASSSRGGKDVRWLVVVWNHADLWRKRHGHGPKDYHITLSEDDDHEVDKGIDSLIHAGMTTDQLLDKLEVLGEDALDHSFVAAKEMFLKQGIAERMITSFADSFKGYARLGEVSAPVAPKLAALSYTKAVELNTSLLPAIASRLRKLRDLTSYGPVVTKAELEAIPALLTPHILSGPWLQELDDHLSGTLWTHQTASRERQLFLGKQELPRFFSWLYPGRVAGMSTPRNEDDIDYLDDMGFTHVLTLTEETPLNPAWFKCKRIRHVYVPVTNYHPPTIAEMDAIFDMVSEGGTWLIHCGGGVGRAGTVLACLIAMLGKGEATYDEVSENTPRLDAGTAISILRYARPRSLETEHQERFVSAWISHRWKLLSQAENARLTEPCTTLKIEGNITNTEITTLFLIGKPGSGKSWFSSALSKRRPKGKTIIISQDDSGSRPACERQLSNASKFPNDTLVILDRCNPIMADRKTWLALLDRPTVAIYFDYPRDLCRQRLNTRLDHPTLRAGRGENALSQMDKDMQPPQLTEGWKAILTISSFPAARQAIRQITPDPPLLKFPRTPHLLNLGSTTSDDLVLSDFTELRGALTIEEKIDGANMGISLDWDGKLRTQNRSHWVSSADHAQFRPLNAWLEANDLALRRILDRDPQFPERFILYGEWMVARHSIHYDSLPAPFIAFDLYDRLEGFVSRRVLGRMLRGSGIAQVPLIMETEGVTRDEVVRLLEGKSCFSGERVEGVYVRTEDDERKMTVGRGKVVRGDFIAGDKHWARGPLVLNSVRT